MKNGHENDFATVAPEVAALNFPAPIRTPERGRAVPNVRLVIRRRSMAGMALVEPILGMGVASVITLASLTVGSKALDIARIERGKSLAAALTGQMEARFATFPNYAVLPTTPASTWVADLPMMGKNIAAPWGPMQLQAATVRTPGDAWAMTFNNVPAGDCARLLAQVSPMFHASGANGQFSSSGEAAAMPPAEAEALCDSESNSVSFISRPSGTLAPVVDPAWATPMAIAMPSWTPPPSSEPNSGSGSSIPSPSAPPKVTDAQGGGVYGPGLPDVGGLAQSTTQRPTLALIANQY